ncbi:MAG: LCP family protein [Bacteroidota bacterium]
MRRLTDHEKSIRRKKAGFWFIILLLFIPAIVFFLKPGKKQAVAPQTLISAAICGEVKHPAVYRMDQGADLSMLIKAAGGLTYRAEIREDELEQILENDSVYHIPARQSFLPNDSLLELQIAETYRKTASDSIQIIAGEYQQKEIRRMNILYIGYPAVYILISYYPDFGRISFIHIPHSTLFLANDDRLIDIYFTLGLEPTIGMLENRLAMKIDYYLIQDRFSFIDMVDLLKGVSINLDEPFAEAYNMAPGPAVLNGFYTWEYIRFLDFKRIKREFKQDINTGLTTTDNFRVAPSEWQNAYTLREERQRIVMQALRIAFQKLNLTDQVLMLNQLSATFETNMTGEMIIDIYRNILNTPEFSYGRLPGYYAGEGNKLFFFPDIPSFSQLRNQEIRTYLVKHNNKEQTAY